MIVKVTFKEDLSAKLRAIALGLEQRQDLMETMAFDLRTAIIDHITTVKVPGQDPGIEYWQQVAQSIDAQATAKDALLTFQKVGVSLRYYGGEVRPGKGLALSGPNKGKPTKALAIPTQEAPIKGGSYQRPSVAGLLAFIAKAKGQETVGFLVSGREKISTRGKRKGQKIVVPLKKSEGGRLYYVLRTVTRHKPDPSFLPTDTRIGEILESSANAWIASLDTD
ncbi:MAG: hypothetical protein QM755_23730 [Luteolibacter sp.]